MPAQSVSFVMTAYLSQSGGSLSVGDVVIPSLSGTDYVLASAANLAATGRSFAGAGIALTAADSNNRAFQLQSTGPIPPEVSGLGSGSGGNMKVSSAGRLARGTASSVELPAGKCDTDGWAYLSFTAVGVADVDDDIAKSAGSTIDRVHGIRGITIDGTDGVAPDVGATLVYNAQGGDSYKLKKPTPPGWQDVTDYGAIGDGSTDDTTAINDAIDAANDAGGGVVYFPPGTYKVTAQLTTPGANVWIRGCSIDSAIIDSYVTDTLIYLSEQNNQNGSLYNGIEHITLQCRVNSSPSTFNTDAGAGVEIRGGGINTIRYCNIRGFPMGVVLDGAEVVTIEDCTILCNDGLGYLSGTANGRGIWLIDSTGRGRGWTIPNAVNVNNISRCYIAGYKSGIEVSGGVSNNIRGVVFLGAGSSVSNLSAITLNGATLNVDISDLECEGYQWTGGSGIKINGVVTGAQIKSSVISAEIPIRITSGVLYSSTIAHNALSPQGSGTYSISAPSASYIQQCVVFDNYLGSAATALIDNDTDSAGFSYNRLGGGGAPVGLSIGKLNAASSLVDAQIYDNTKPIFRASHYGEIDIYSHSLETYTKQGQSFRLCPVANNAGTLGGGAFGFAETADLSNGAGNSVICDWTVPTGCDSFAAVTFKVTQWRDDDITKHGVWNCSQLLHIVSGTITFEGSLNDDVAADNTGSFTHPDLVDNGDGTIGIKVYQHATYESYVTAVINVISTVRQA